MTNWSEYLSNNQERFLQEYIEFLSIPSVSTSSEHVDDVRRAAEWVAKRLKQSGFELVEVMRTDGHPVVYGEWLKAPGKPTILIYGHFDVQPAEPFDLWTTPPFVPSVRDGRIYARGASDMKGSLLTTMIAIESMLKTSGALPLNVKVLYEGEEEIGSPSLESFVALHKNLLACDMMVSADSGQSDHYPVLNYGLRGLLGLQIDIKTANTDLHSGGGGLLPNPIHALVRVLDSMRDESGRVLVDGFYDGVEEIDEEERNRIAAVPDNQQEFFDLMGIKVSFGEPEYTPAERQTVRPTLEINGIWGGFTGEGTKTVIPSEAHAKITCRLVPNQHPDELFTKIVAHLEKHTPEYATLRVTQFQGKAEPYLMPLDHPGLQASARVVREIYGKDPVPVRGGGTIPILGLMLKYLGVYTVSFGFSGSNENGHAPNEFSRLANFELGQHGYCRLFEELAK